MSYFFARFMGVKLALRGVIVDERDGAGEGGTPPALGSSFLSRFDRSMFWYPCLLSNRSCSSSASLRQLRLALCLGAFILARNPGRKKKLAK